MLQGGPAGGLSIADASMIGARPISLHMPLPSVFEGQPTRIAKEGTSPLAPDDRHNHTTTQDKIC